MSTDATTVPEPNYDSENLSDADKWKLVNSVIKDIVSTYVACEARMGGDALRVLKVALYLAAKILKASGKDENFLHGLVKEGWGVAVAEDELKMVLNLAKRNGEDLTP